MTINYYNATARNYNELHGEEQIQKAQIAKQQINVSEADQLLDVGCGTGISTSVFPCYKTGLDPANELLKQAEFHTINTYAESIPFEDNSFDIVTSFTAVHNFYDYEQGLNEIKRVAKDKVIISVLKKANWFERIENLIRKKFELWRVIDNAQDKIFILSVPQE